MDETEPGDTGSDNEPENNATDYAEYNALGGFQGVFWFACDVHGITTGAQPSSRMALSQNALRAA